MHYPLTEIAAHVRQARLALVASSDIREALDRLNRIEVILITEQASADAATEAVWEPTPEEVRNLAGADCQCGSDIPF